jgi:transcriptional regulator with XRE-family HTH domain
MATNEVPRGPISAYVVENVKRLRAERRWSLADLSKAMGEKGRPMLSSGLHRLETGKRRIDADDLVALALAFDVSPMTLLLPWAEEGKVSLTDTVTADVRAAWLWARGEAPLQEPEDWDEAQFAKLQFHLNAVPRGFRLGNPRTKGGSNGEHQEAP